MKYECDYCYRTFEHYDNAYFNHNCDLANAEKILIKCNDIHESLVKAWNNGKLNNEDFSEISKLIVKASLTIRKKWKFD